MYHRYKQITAYKDVLNDLLQAMFNHPNVNFRYIIMPSGNLPRSYIPIDFDKKCMNEMIE